MRTGILIAGRGQGHWAWARYFQKRCRDVPCYFWSDQPGCARILDRRLAGSGWFNSFAIAVNDERISVVVLTLEEDRLQYIGMALAAGKHVVLPSPRVPSDNNDLLHCVMQPDYPYAEQ